MIPYFILILVPLIFFLLGLIKGKNNNKLCISVFFIILIALLSLRSVKTGTDLAQYKRIFDILSVHSLNENLFFLTRGEYLYYALNKTISLLGLDFQALLIVCALLSILPIFLLYYKKVDNAMLTLALFITVAPFSIFFSGLRQSIAIGIIIFAFKFVEKKQPIKYFIFVIIAFFFHRSCFVCLLLYPLYHVIITKKWLYIIIPTIIFFFVFNEPILILLKNTINIYNGEIEYTGAYTLLLLLVIFAIYTFALPNDKKTDKEFIGLRNILLLSIFIQIFASLHPFIMRFNYYFLIFIPLLIPKVANYSSNTNKKFLQLSTFVMTVFFIIYFFYNGYTTFNSSSSLNIFPYIPFWR